MDKLTQQRLALGIGGVLLSVLLVLAAAVPSPTQFQLLVFRTTLALGAAGLAAILPGFLTISVPAWLRAGGSLAVFVIVYKYNPAVLADLNGQVGTAEAARGNIQQQLDTLTQEDQKLWASINGIVDRSAAVPAETPVRVEPTPMRRYLGQEIDRCSADVVTVHDGSGGTRALHKGETLELGVALDEDGLFHWDCDGSSEQTRPSDRSTNRIICSRDSEGRRIVWDCFHVEQTQ